MTLQQKKMTKVQKKKKIMCPVCSCKLVLKQINLDTAVYLCLKTDCVYPLGHDWMMVNRNLSQMYEDNQKKMKRRVLNVDKFLDTITDEPITASGDDNSIMKDLQSIDCEQQQKDSSFIPAEGEASLMDCDILNQTELCNEFNFDEMMDELTSKPTYLDQADSNGIDFDFTEFMDDFSAASTEEGSQNNNSKVIILDHVILERNQV